jgi:hypothetical protein
MDESWREHLGDFKECFSSSDNLRFLELWNFQVRKLVQPIFYLSNSLKDPRRNVCRDRFIDGVSPTAWLLPQVVVRFY